VHHPAAYTRLKFDPVGGIDLDPNFEFTAKVEFPDIHPMTGDIANLPEKSWDIVTCSHTIEHVEDPAAFVNLLKRLARKYLLLACPYAEKDLSPGHIVSIDYFMLNSLGFQVVQIYESHHWHNGVCCMALMAL
jgi:SAM-dependent methyltransferase